MICFISEFEERSKTKRGDEAGRKDSMSCLGVIVYLVFAAVLALFLALAGQLL